jgi:hypothetical protein
MKYTVTFSKENCKRLYQTFIEADNEKEAFLHAVSEAENKGIEIPKEVWTRIKQHKLNDK